LEDGRLGSRGHGRSSRWGHIGRVGRIRGRGGFRGPRKAAEPTGDIKFRMSRASLAFIEEKYEEARDLVSEVIRINAETYEAWTLLASIFKELGDIDKTLMALMYAAHLRPKDVASWLNCAQFALEETGENRTKYLPSAQFCYSSALRADPKNFDARCGKAAVYLEQGNTALAISEYRNILSRRPHDTSILRRLAEAYIDQDEVGSAKEFYKESIVHFKTSVDIAERTFGWSDINIYIELYGYLGQYNEAMKELKSLARWLLGRDEETYWDMVINDDREWDAGDLRRVECPDYAVGRFPLSTYGAGLPLELRVKLGLYRLHLGHHEEALVRFNLYQTVQSSF
jgi:general transcription factor 3C polypeptide 3 (transcription factor C subunit 4)